MLRFIIISGCLLLVTVCAAHENPTRPRVREAGVQVGVIPAGPLNAITDVAGRPSRANNGHTRRERTHRCDRDPAARWQSLPREGARSSVCWKRFRQIGWIDTSERTG